MGSNNGTKGSAKRRGDFFGVDIDTFRAVCSLGSADYCAGYLILAAGTDGGNRVTSWSREAINKRTSLTWRKADDFVSAMIDRGFASWVRKGARPRLELHYINEKKEPSASVVKLLAKLDDGKAIDTPSQRSALSLAKREGFIVENTSGDYERALRHKLVWLPKELVEWNGPHRPPVERVRKAQDAETFRLLVDIYAEQDLAELGGLSAYNYYCGWEQRAELAQTGQFKIWQFEGRKDYVREAGPIAHHYRVLNRDEEKRGVGKAQDAFDRLALLHDAGVLEWVYYLAESDDARPNLIHPVAVVRHGKVVEDAVETRIGIAAQRAGLALAGYRSDADAAAYQEAWPWRFVLPAERVLRRVQLIGIVRTRHRAKTSNAARWLQKITDEAPAYLAQYTSIIADHAPALIPTEMGGVADFNATSTKISTLVQSDLNGTDRSTMHPFAA